MVIVFLLCCPFQEIASVNCELVYSGVAVASATKRGRPAVKTVHIRLKMDVVEFVSDNFTAHILVRNGQNYIAKW